MTERVQCAECADVYDSDEHPFCPRCGAISTKATPTAAVAIADRADPRRRRVQAAGVMMASTGAVMLVLAIAAIAMAPDLVPGTLEAFAGEQGGDLEVVAVQAGSPAANVTVRVLALNDTVLATASTDGNGTARFADVSSAAVRVQVGDVWEKRTLVPQGANQRIDADLDASGTGDDWVGLDGFIRGTQILSGLFALLSVLTIAGGVAAVRLRQRNLAIAGAMSGGLPWIILFFASMSILVLMVLAFYVLAFVFLRQGRALFTQ